MLWSARLVSAVAILSLALGIGANTAIFALVDSLLLRSLPVKNPSQLVLITDENGPPRPWTYPVWEQLRDRPELFDASAAWTTTRADLTSGGEAQFADTVWATGSFFGTLGVPAILGRTLAEVDDQRGGGPNGPVAVISYDFWQRRFGGAADAIGRTLRLNAAPFTIVGITPPEFFGPEIGHAFDVVVPLETMPHQTDAQHNGGAAGSLTTNLAVMARLKAGQTLEQAAAILRGVQPQIREATLPTGWPKQFLPRYMNSPFVVVSAATGNSSLQRRYERPLLTILVVVGLVLAIACANIASLLLARATARRHELSVRRALGASRWRLVRQLLIESALLAAVGSAVGLALGAWGSRFLVVELSTPANPLFLDLSFDSHVGAFAAGAALLTTLLFGVAPALRAARVMPMDALKQEAPTMSDRSHLGAAGVLVVAQVGLSLVLIVAAALFVHTFVSLARRPLGFDATRVLVVNIDAQRATIAPSQRVAAFEAARAAVAALPGVAAAAVSAFTPIVSGRPMLGQPIEAVSGAAPLLVPGDPHAQSALNLVSPGWFDTFSERVIDGRDIDAHDRVGTPPVAIVNEAFARKFLNGASAVGHTITIALPGPPTPPIEIVGVATDAVYGASLRNPVPATMYLPLTQLTDVWQPFVASATLSVRSAGAPPAALIKRVAAAIGDVNPEMALTFETVHDQLRASLVQERVVAMLSGLFGALALLLAGLGLYGVTAYAVSRRRTEIGIRMALGAAPGGIVRLVLSRAAVLVGLGIVAGAGLSLWASRFIASLLYGLQPRDPATLAGASLLLALVATFAAWLPARHASRIDPAAVLRSE